MSPRHTKATWLHILVSTQMLSTSSVLFEFDEEWTWLAADEEVGQYILVRIHVHENAYLFFTLWFHNG